MGLRKLFKRILRTGKEAGTQSEPTDTSGDYASAKSEHLDITSEEHESEKEFHEAENLLLESLSDDSWIYEEDIGKPQELETRRQAHFERSARTESIFSDVDAPYEIDEMTSVKRELDENSEREFSNHDHAAVENFHEDEMRSFESSQNKIWENEELGLSPHRKDSSRQEPPLPPDVLFHSEPETSATVTESQEPKTKGTGKRRLTLKKCRERSSPRKMGRLGHKTFISNKDTETNRCLPPRTTPGPSGVVDDATSPAEGVDLQAENDDITQAAELGLSIIDIVVETSGAISDNTTAQQDEVSGVISNVVTTEALDPANFSNTVIGEIQQLAPIELNVGHVISRSELEGRARNQKLHPDVLSAGFKPVTVSMSSLDTRSCSKAIDYLQPDLFSEDLEEEDYQGTANYLEDGQEHDGLTDFLYDGMSDYEPREDTTLDAVTLEEVEDFTDDKGYDFDDVFDDDLDGLDLLDEVLPNAGTDHSVGEPERISQYLRACQRAVEFIRKNHWDDGYLHALAEVLNTRGYGAILTHLQRHADGGMVPEEFLLAIQLKALWSQNRMLWIAFKRNGDSDSSYRVLSWAQCLRIIRIFGSSMGGGIPQIEEVERFIENLFDEWYEDDGLRRYFKSFSKYLNYVAYRADPDIPMYMQFKWESDDMEAEDALGWVPMDPMCNNLHRNLTHFGITFKQDYPEEAETCFDLRYLDPQFNPEVESKNDSTKSKIKTGSDNKGKEENIKENINSSERLHGEKSERNPSSLSSNLGSSPRSMEEVISSLQDLFLKGYSKDEAARTLGLNNTEIKNCLLVMK